MSIAEVLRIGRAHARDEAEAVRFDEALKRIVNCKPPASDKAASEPNEREPVVPEDRRKLKGPDGKDRDAVSIGFRSNTENWSDYVLDDGTLLRLKPVVGEILKVEGLWDPEGNPVYVVKAQNFIVVNAPQDQRKGQGK